MFSDLQIVLVSSLTCVLSLQYRHETAETTKYQDAKNSRSDLPQPPSASSSSSSSSSSTTGSGSASFCENILPGLEAIVRGIDITKLDLMHDYSVDSSDGFTESLFDYTCRKSRKIIIEGKEYDIPDQIQNIKLIEQDQSTVMPQTSEVRLFEDFRILKNYFSSVVGLGRASAKGWFSETQSLSHFQRIMINSSNSLVTMDASVPLFTVTVPSKLPLRRYLSEFLSDYLEQELPENYENDPSRYLDFLKTYGTHYFRTTTLGGVIKIWSEVEPSVKKSLPPGQLQSKAQILYDNLLVNFAGSNSNNTLDNISKTLMKSTHARVYGGDPNSFKTRGFQTWKSSLMKDPKLVSFSLSPITDLVKDNNKRQQLTKAMDVYFALAYLQESRRLLQVYLIVLPNKVRENIENLMKKIDEIQEIEIPSYDVVKQLLEQL